MFHRRNNKHCTKYKTVYSEKQLSEECSRPLYRHVVSSSDDADRMALESSRARLISQLVSEPQEKYPRDFSSYFYGTKKDMDPLYVITTHTASNPLPHKKLVIPTYPITQELRWNPYVETVTIDDYVDSQTVMEDKSKYNCRCENCKSDYCPSKVSSSTTLQPNSLRTNIATFHDSSTMTVRQNDACCGLCTPLPPSPDTSDVSICPSDISVNNTCTQMQKQDNGFKRIAPIPLLRYSDFAESHEDRCTRKPCSPEISDETARDYEEDDCKEPIRSWSIKSFLKLNKKKNDDDKNICRYKIQSDSVGRKVLYNEGISDYVTRHKMERPRATSACRPPERVDTTPPVSANSGNMLRSKCPVNIDRTIPFSHRGESKYHMNCSKTFSKHKQEMDPKLEEMRHVVDSPHIVSKTYCYTPGRPSRSPCISQPRKMLTSEQDIELFIDKRRPKGYRQICKRK